jgi:hypothetical protein
MSLQFVDCGWIIRHTISFSQELCVENMILYLTPYYKLVVIFELLVSSVIPLCVITFTYTMTALHLKESSRSISEGSQNPQLNTCRNTAMLVVGLTVVFMISYVPYHILWNYVICTESMDVYSSIYFNLDFGKYDVLYPHLISTYFLLINPCLNPVALFFTSSPFRQLLKRYLTCCCKTNSPPSDIELTRRNWICNTWHYFLYTLLGYIFYENFHLSNDSKGNWIWVALWKLTLSVEKVNICTDILHYIQRKLQKNSYDKI